VIDIRALFKVIAGLAIALWTGGCAAQQRVDADELTRMAAESMAEDRILIVYVTATWCRPCQWMERDTWSDASVQDWIDQYASKITLDHYRDAELAVDRLGAHSIPQTIIFKDGQEYDRLVGYRSAESVLEWLDAVVRSESYASLVRAKYGDAVERAIHDAVTDMYYTGNLLLNEQWEEAAEHLATLWRHREWPDLNDIQRAHVPFYIGRLIDDYEPARQMFLTLRDEVTSERPSEDEEALLRDWLHLSAACGDDDALIDWFESLDDLSQNRRLIDAVGGRVFWMYNASLTIALIEANRWDSLWRLWEHQASRSGHADVPRFAMASLDDYASLFRQLGAISHDEIRHAMRYEGAAEYTLMLAMDSESAAQQIARRLLRRLDDAPTRIALVERAVGADLARREHLLWLEQARLRGMNRPDLVAAVEHGLMRMAGGE
jgi:thiol-disulfide isomerase/thioredoxin